MIIVTVSFHLPPLQNVMKFAKYFEVSFSSGFEYNVKQIQKIEGFPAAAKRMKMENCDENDEMMKFKNFATGANGDKSEYDLYKR